MDDVFHRVFSGCVEQALGRKNIVPNEFFGSDATDLRVPYHEHLTTGEASVPGIVHRQIRSYDAYGRVLLFQDRAVRGVLVDRRDRRVPASVEVSYEVLPDQAGPSRNDDALIRHWHVLSNPQQRSGDDETRSKQSHVEYNACESAALFFNLLARAASDQG